MALSRWRLGLLGCLTAVSSGLGAAAAAGGGPWAVAGTGAALVADGSRPRWVIPRRGVSSAAVESRPQPEEWGENLTPYPGFQHQVGISGSRVVWADARDGFHLQSIVLHDLEAGTQEVITPRGTNSIIPAIDGDRIVYARIGAEGPWEFYSYDIPTGIETLFRRVSRSQGLGRFSVSGHRVVWHERRENDGNWDVYLYDMETRTVKRLTTDPAEQADPSIEGDLVAWADRRHGGIWWDAYLLDLRTGKERRLTQATTLARGPVVSGTAVVWGDLRGGNFSLFVHDVVAESEQRLPTSDMENALDVSWPWIAWVNRNDDVPAFYDDVLVYNLQTGRETRLTSSPARQWLPALAGDFIVWEDFRNGDDNADVYFQDLARVAIPGSPRD